MKSTQSSQTRKGKQMKGLFLKDAYVLWKNSKFILIISAVFIIASIAMGVSDFDNTVNFLSVFSFLFVGVLPMNLLSYDESYRWDSYAAAMPYTKLQLVSVKFLLAIALNLSVFCLLMVGLAVKAFIIKEFPAEELFIFSSMLLAFGFLYPSLMLPFIFKFGVQKSRLMYAFLYGVSYSLFVMFYRRLPDISGFLSRISLSAPAAIVLTCAAVFGLYALSWALSVKFYKQREF